MIHRADRSAFGGERISEVVTSLARIRDVLDSNPGQNVGYSIEIFVVFLSLSR
jgi:hypothetical protein